jgi:hypothetical protein
MFGKENDDASSDRCFSCGRPIDGEKVCRCGAGTENMSFAERTAYELEQYKAYKAAKTASA